MTNKNQLIEQFLDGELKSKGIQLFLQQKEKDLEFADEYFLRMEINNAIQDKEFIEFSNILDDKRKRFTKKSPYLMARKEVLKSWHLAAASFSLVVVAGGLWYILSNKSASTDKLVAKYYKPAHPGMQVRSAKMNTEESMKEAFSLYRENKFESALIYFNTIGNQITAKFYSGICYIELGEYDKAVKSFNYIVEDNDNLFVEQSEWYVGIIHLMNNKNDEAIAQFKKISASNSYYAEQAKDILSYIN
ncbi:MAG: hypothetical protein DRJ05_05170 [Bacteroidetes bacterium]|nr:MAG: hypothetical protein DRJ05_05170 [Bacteroidota bacterium]